LNGDDITGGGPRTASCKRAWLLSLERRNLPNLSVYRTSRWPSHHRRRPPHGRVPRAVLALFPAPAVSPVPQWQYAQRGEHNLTMARRLAPSPAPAHRRAHEGLMPAFVETIGRPSPRFHARAVAVLLVEQNTRLALEATQRVYVIGRADQARSASRDLARRDASAPLPGHLTADCDLPPLPSRGEGRSEGRAATAGAPTRDALRPGRHERGGRLPRRQHLSPP